MGHITLVFCRRAALAIHCPRSQYPAVSIHVCGGTEPRRRIPVGIDWFMGQKYSAAKMDRVLTVMKSRAPETRPRWARMLEWFLGLRPTSTFPADGMYQWQEDQRRILGSSIPFDLAVDASGLTLQNRMERRQETRQQYTVWAAQASFTEGSEYEASTSMNWGATSRQYLDTRAGQSYVCLGADRGWWYVVEVDKI